MNDRGEQPVHGWRHKLPLALGIGASGLLFIYLVLPGFILGVLIRCGAIDLDHAKPVGWSYFEKVFCVPLFLSEQFRPLEEFYAWQCDVVSGYR